MKDYLKSILFLGVGAFILTLSACIKGKESEAIGILNDDVSLYTLRNIWKGKPLTLDRYGNLGGARYTSGIVVSQSENGNFPEGYIAIQNTWRGQLRGMLLKVDNPLTYEFGDSLQVDLEGTKLSDDFDGNLALSGLNSEAIVVLAKNKFRNHKAVSIGNLNGNIDMYEGTLVSVTSDVENVESGKTLEGENTLVDGNGDEMKLVTDEDANFKDQKVAPNATFAGIALKSPEGGSAIYMQSIDDMLNPSGKIYSGWPESFEVADDTLKSHYDMPWIDNTVKLSTGNWYLYYAIIANTAGRDRIVSGDFAVRMQQNRTEDEYLEMDFDVPNGASKVTFWYGSYYNDRSSTFKLEYSTDQGLSWHQIGQDITDAHPQSESSDSKLATFLMDIQGPVRFRINKLGLGTSSPTVSNGRLGIDDFAIYEGF